MNKAFATSEAMRTAIARQDGARVTPDFLRAVGELLYGDRWQTPLAASLGAIRGKPLSPATVHQWTTRKRSIPPWVRDALSQALEHGQSDMTSRAEIAGEVARMMRSTDRRSGI